MTPRDADTGHKPLVRGYRPNWLRSLAAALFLLALGWPCPSRAQALRAERLQPGEVLARDGSLDHPAWQRAPEHTAFVEFQPRNGAAPTERTSVRLLYDEQALYVGVIAYDRTPQAIRDVPVRHDNVNRTQDFVVAYVDAIGHKASAQFFRVNAAGSLADGLHTAADDSEDFSPDFDWDAWVQRRADGWSAMLRLPFASLRYAQTGADGASRPWRFMLGRRVPREQVALMLSVALPRESPSFIDRLQPVDGLTLPSHARFLTVRPSLTLRQRESQASRSAAAERQSKLDAGLDLKWRPHAEWVVDATLRPDFSQVALDVPQLSGNSRFALFIPEKRPFFFESADLLRSPTDALYTRSITQPQAGLRATLRSDSWQGTALGARDRGGGLVLLPSPYGTDVAEQPGSRVVAARLRHPAMTGQSVSWGGLVASRSYDGARGTNDVLGVDADAALGQGWRLRTQVLGSRTTALAQGGELREGAAETGHRGYLWVQRLQPGLETSVTFDALSPRFRHDTGFVNRNGIRSLGAFHSWKWEAVGPFNNLDLYLDAHHVQDTVRGQAIDRGFHLGIWTSGARNLEWWAEWHPPAAVRTRPDGAVLRPHFIATGLVLTPAVWWPLLETNLTLGRLTDSVADRLRDGARWRFSAKLRPWRALELEPSLSVDALRRGGGAGGFAYRESALQLLGVWHLNAQQNLRVIVQRQQLDRQAETGVAAQREVFSTGSLTWQWRQSAGTHLYVGLSREATAGGGPRGTEAFVKLQFDTEDAQAWLGRAR